MDELEPEPCWQCDDERVLVEDHFTSSRGHWTTERACDACSEPDERHQRATRVHRFCTVVAKSSTENAR